MSPLLLALPLWLSVPTAQAAGARAISPPTPGNCQAPRWSRDGARLAYEVNFHDRKVVELHVYTPGAGSPRQVLPVQRGGAALTRGFGGAGPAVAHEATWSPPLVDRVVYSAATSGGGDFDLYMDRAGALAAAPGTDGGPTWSPDGRWIAFSSARSGQGDLYVLDAHQISDPPRQLTTAPDTSELFPDWSPDGARLVYVGHGDSGDRVLLLDDVHGQPAPVALTPGAGTQTRPRFSPDGRHVAFFAAAGPDEERWDLHVVEARAGATSRLLVEGIVLNPRGPAWTPDSQALVTVQDDDARYDPVLRVPVSGGGPSPLATGTVGNSDLDVVEGTDGRTWLAVAAQGRDGDEVRDFKRIYVMPLP